MMNEIERIDNEKALLKAAHSVWAANKYFVLACSQDNYNEIRRLLRPENKELTAAYKILDEVNARFITVPSGKLLQISNALYHIVGYFKKRVSKEKRDEIIYLIESNPQESISELENQTKMHHVEYLSNARIWPILRDKPFNIIPLKLKVGEEVYSQNELLWIGNHLALNPDYVIKIY